LGHSKLGGGRRRGDLDDDDSGGRVPRRRGRLGEATKAAGALGVLSMNVAMLVVSASVTLALQRVLMLRTVARRGRSASSRQPVG
jgi:hypothetical protein